MNERYTSRVFDAGIRIFEKLEAAQLPAHPVTGLVPTVTFGDEHPDAGFEKICLVLDVEGTENAWVRLGPGGRDEPMLFVIRFRSFVPAVETPRAVWDRLAEVSAAIEDVFYDRTTRKVRPLGFDGETEVGRTSGVDPSVAPSQDGFIGLVDNRVSLLASI